MGGKRFQGRHGFRFGRHRDDEASPPQLPSIMRRLNTDEYRAPMLDRTQMRAVDEIAQRGPTAAHRLARPLGDYWSSRLGTAAGLRALNAAFGDEYFAVPAEATMEQAAADESFEGRGPVVDVQTHYMADRPSLSVYSDSLLRSYRAHSPDWWTGLDDLTFYGFAEYLRCVFVEGETTVAILTAPPPDVDGESFLHNHELAGTRELLDRLGATGRLLNHTVVHPNDPSSLERMAEWKDTLKPVGWKVYTMGRIDTEVAFHSKAGTAWEAGWMLDDETTGVPFLEEARRLGVRNICSHKGLSAFVDNGSPRDIGPSAQAFPDLRFIVYHSGFEGIAEDEGPYTENTAHLGINRLITTAAQHGIGAGGNIYAELGTTWFCLVKRPREAAHVLGKLLTAFGEDNILWGTDGIWYGPVQPVIDAFRSFQIPASMREEFGYPELTPEIKEKILGSNAGRVYEIDLAAITERARRDDLSWTREALRSVGVI